MENRVINLAVVAEIAKALGNLNELVVFVGGAVVSLYTDDPAADEIRPTQDIDLTIKIVNLFQWEKIQRQLDTLGFQPDPFGHSISSFIYKNIRIDILSTEDSPLGNTNPWFKIGFESLGKITIENQIVNILSAPCFLATKFEAFKNRGKDYRTSHDIEDIIYILDNRIKIVEEIKICDLRIRSFLCQEFGKTIKLGILKDVLMAHIHPLMIEERLPMVEEKIYQILKDE